MTAGKQDRRVRRTKELLCSALLALIQEKGYDRLTVQDIIDRADVGRSTFYAHFRDKDDLLFYGLEEVREAFRPGQEHATLHVFEHFARNGEVWRAMVGRRGGEMFMRYLHGLLSDLLRSQLAARAAAGGDPAVPLDALVEFATSTLIGLGRWWMEQGVALSPKEMDRLYRRLTEPGIRAGLRPLPAAR